jgi:hypothetical protein
MAPSTPTPINSELLKQTDKSDIVTQTVDAMKKLDENPEIAREITKYGKVPTIYVPTRGMIRPPAVPGLSYFISQATTVKEVENLLTNGKEKYTNASSKTIRRWEQQSQDKIVEINRKKNQK